MLLRSVVYASIDAPHADGIVNPGGRGHMRSWRFDDTSSRDYEIQLVPDRTQKVVEEWNHQLGSDTMRSYPQLGCAGPAPDLTALKNCTLYNFDLPSDGTGRPDGEWKIDRPASNYSNLWYECVPANYPRKTWLWWRDGRGMYDGSTAYAGKVSCRTYIDEETTPSNFLYDDPNFWFRAYRFFPSPDFADSHYTYLEILLQQLAGADEALSWSIGIPGPTTDASYRDLYLGISFDNENWTVVKRFQTRLPEIDEFGIMAESLWFEVIDGHFVIDLNGDRFLYRVPEIYLPGTEDEGITIYQPTAHVITYGHSAMFNFSRLDYVPIGETSLRTVYPIHPDIFNVSPGSQEGTVSAWTPEGTTATCWGIYDSTDTDGSYLYRPQVKCESDQPHWRSVVYLAGVDWPPDITAGSSAPISTQDYNWVTQASGSIGEDWRHSTCNLQIEMDPADWVGVAPNLKGNNKMAVTGGWYTDSGLDTYTQFTGYLRQRAHSRPAEKPDRVVIDLPCEDAFFRLSKKYWLDLGCFEGQHIGTAFGRVLNQCGFPDSLIAVDADVTADETLVIERPKLGAQSRLYFREDTSVPDGLNSLVTSLGLQWGVDQTGIFFLREPLVYVDGTSTIAYTLDEDTETDTEVVYAVRSETQFDQLADGRPFANYVMVRIERGGEEQIVEVWDYDPDDYARSLSHHVTTEDNFFGDDWWHVIVAEDAQSAYDLANRIIRDRMGKEGVAGRQQTISFRADGKPGLFPGDYVKVQIVGLPAATDAVFQIVDKHWSAGPDKRFTADYTARFVQ